jgi:hypothetical protein
MQSASLYLYPSLKHFDSPLSDHLVTVVTHRKELEIVVPHCTNTFNVSAICGQQTLT